MQLRLREGCKLVAAPVSSEAEKPGFTIEPIVMINSVFWIRCLPEAEAGPTRRIIEDVEPAVTGGEMAFFERTANEPADVVAILEEIATLAAAGLKPIIHFDGHGSVNDGLQIGNSGKSIGWKVLTQHLRRINILTGNNLVCVFATCHGYNIARHVDITQPAPYYLLFAPEELTYVGFLVDRTANFYKLILTGGSITQAFQQTLSGELSLFHCEGALAKGIALYIRNFGRGKTKAARVEKAFTEMFGEGKRPSTRNERRQMRKKLKQSFGPGQHVIDHFEKKFMIGRKCTFDYEAIRPMTTKPSQTGI